MLVGVFSASSTNFGYRRDARDTPYDVLRTVHQRFRNLAEPARRLTTLYVRAAYSEQQLSGEDRQSVIDTLGAIAEQVARRARIG